MSFPTPPKHELKSANHHWLDVYDSDGHYFERVIRQWAPQAQKWCHSGNVGTGIYTEDELS